MPRSRKTQRRSQGGDDQHGEDPTSSTSSEPRLPLPILQRIFELRLFGDFQDDCGEKVYGQTLTTLLSVNKALHDYVRNDILRCGCDVDFVERYEDEHQRVLNFNVDSDARPAAVIQQALSALFFKCVPSVALFRHFEQALQRWWPTNGRVAIVESEAFDLCFCDLSTGAQLKHEQAMLDAMPNISLLQRNLHIGGEEEQQARAALRQLVQLSMTESETFAGPLLFKALASQVFASHAVAYNEIDVCLPETYYGAPLDKLPLEYRVFLQALEDRRRDVAFTLTLQSFRKEDDLDEDEWEDEGSMSVDEDETPAEKVDADAKPAKEEDGEAGVAPPDPAMREHEQRLAAPPTRPARHDTDITALMAADERLLQYLRRSTARHPRHQSNRMANMSTREAMNIMLAAIHGYDPRQLAAEGFTMADVLDPTQGRMDSNDDDWYRRMDEMTNGPRYDIYDDDDDDDMYGYY